MQETILILTNSVGGLYNFRQEVVQAFVNEGYKVVIAAPNNKRVTFFEDMGCVFRMVSFKLKGTNPLSDLRLAFEYCKVIKETKPFVVLTYTIKPNLYGGLACRWCSVPQVANITGLGSAVENKGWLQKVIITLYRVCMRKTHLIFFQNNANFHFFRDNHILKGKSELIPGSGVNLNFYSYQEYPTDDTIRFMFISRILRQKGIDQYLEAAAIIKKSHPSTEFHVFGGCGEDYSPILHDLNEKGIIIYHGHEPETRPFYKMTHCTIHPSYYPEGMSNVLLESCAMGRPIITTNRPGCGEIVDDGVNGFLVRQKDTADLVMQIEKFLRLSYDEKKQMGINARKKVEREFDRNFVVDAYLRVIMDVEKNSML